MDLFTTIWRQTANLVFSPKSAASTNSKATVHSQLNHGSRKTGQAAGAGGFKQDRYVGICDIRPCFCGLRTCDCLWPADASARLGGKGTVRRKIVRKSKPSNTQDDKKLQGALKKLNVQPITGVEEVNMFREDGNVLHFSAPKGKTSRCPVRDDDYILR